MSIDDWTPQSRMHDLSDSGPLPPGERETMRENLERATQSVEWKIEEMFSEPDMEMLKFKADEKKWISAGYGNLRIQRHLDKTYGRIYKSIVFQQFEGTNPILNRKITHEVRVTPYPIKNAVEVILPDAVLAFRKSTPFNPDEPRSASTVASTKSDDILVVSDMMNQLNINHDEFASPSNPPTPSDLHIKGAVAWRLLETLRDKTDARQTSFRGVLYAFRCTNIIMWRFKQEWQQYGDGELNVYQGNNKWFIKWTRGYDQKVMLHAIMEPHNTEYPLGAAPLSRGVMFSVVRASQDGENWNVMFQCRGAKTVSQSYAESIRSMEASASQMQDESDNEDNEESTTLQDDEDAMAATPTHDTSMSGDNELMQTLEESIEMPRDEYRRMVHWAFLKALARTPARPTRVGVKRNFQATSSSSISSASQSTSTEDTAMDTS